MSGGFYFQWKYPNTSRRLTKFFLVCLIIYIPIYFLFIASPKKKVQIKNLQKIHGSVEYFEIPSATDKQIAILRLREHPSKQFSFDMICFNGLEIIHNGDSVMVLAFTEDIQKNSSSISSYELRKNNDSVFSLNTYNSSLQDDLRLGRAFLWIAVICIALYLIMEKTGLTKRIEKQMTSPDSKFQPNEPNFNEFLDQ